ncbi:hypothetical protein ACJ7VZ_05350 [Aeromonas salmonicida]|uniref:hypothetical protein n=1 Tax=Aeromonas salmonicida TaxID=645 RepID=UPI0038BBBC3B
MGVPIFELEQWPVGVIDEYRSLNLISPFTTEAAAQRDGLIVQFLRNQHVTKKSDYVPANQIFPYLNQYPTWLEHEDIKKAKMLLGNATIPSQIEEIKGHIQETLDQEVKKVEPDKYLVVRLNELLNK